MTDPLHLAEQLAEGQLQAEHIRWLTHGFRAYLHGESLERALKLTKSDCVRARNRALLLADEILTGGSVQLTPWQRAGRLHDAQIYFLRRVLPGLKQSALERLSPLNQALETAARSGARQILSQRRLHKLLSDG